MQDLCVALGFMFELIFIPRVTLVQPKCETRARRVGDTKRPEKKGKMPVMVTIGFHSFHVSVHCCLVGGALPTQRAVDEPSLTMLMCAGTLEVFTINGTAHQDTSMFMFHVIIMK